MRRRWSWVILRLGIGVSLLSGCGPPPPAVSGPIFSIGAQCPVRNGACTACDGTADAQDGAFVNLASTVGGFMWHVDALPAVEGRNGLAPDWTLYTNSRAHGLRGPFGATGAMMECFERVRRGDGRSVVYLERQVREFAFNLRTRPGLAPGAYPGGLEGATARSRYEVMRETPAGVFLRRPDGERRRFHSIDGSPLSGRLRWVENRFGDRISYAYDARGRLTTVTDVYGRVWSLEYDAAGRVAEILEEETTLRERFVRFSYDGAGRLARIDTTPVLTDGGIGNTFPGGKPYLLGYAAAGGDRARETNITTVVYPREVLDGSLTPRITNTYDADDRLATQTWGGTNASGVPAGGTITYAYGTGTTTVTDRNGNRTVYAINGLGLPVRIEEHTNRQVRGGVDPPRFVTRYEYNIDEEITRVGLPQGNQILNEYDVMNRNRFAHGNHLTRRRRADALRGGNGEGRPIRDLVETFTYEPIWQLPRTTTSPRGNHPVGNPVGFTPPIPDREDAVESIDFDVNGTAGDEGPTPEQNLRIRRYTTLRLYDYQEGSGVRIEALAAKEGIRLSAPRADALSMNVDLNWDGTTRQQLGRLVELRAPNVVLENGVVHRIRRNFRWNDFGLLTDEIGPEGYVTRHLYSPAATPNATAGAGADQGGYLLHVIADATEPQIRTPFMTPPDPAPVRATTTTLRDAVGNVIAVVNPRGIRDDSVVNERNQVQVVIRASDTSRLSPRESSPVPPLDYETRYHYDANDNVVLRAVENVVDVGGGIHRRVAGNPFLETRFIYDLLDEVVEETVEVAAGETRMIRGLDFAVGPSESLTTQSRYDHNQNRVFVRSPLAVLGVEPDNVTTAIPDERDLPWKSTRGGHDPQFVTLDTHEIALRCGTTEDTATTRTSVDPNGNVVLEVDAEDNGHAHDGTGLPDTDDPSVAGLQRGDPTRTIYDGFDRPLVVIDAMGYRVFAGCACGGGEVAYDPDSNVLASAAIGPAGRNERGGGQRDRLLSRTRSSYDELSRVYRRDTELYHAAQTSGPAIPDDVLISRTLFDRASRVVREIRPLGNFTEWIRDGLDRPIVRRTNPLAGPGGPVVPSEILHRYDDNGNLVQTCEIEREVSAAAREERFFTDIAYDAIDRPRLVISNHADEANAERTEYDSRGNVVAVIDANGSQLELVELNRPTPLTIGINATGNATIFVHDGLDREIAAVHELRLDHDGDNPLDTSNPRNADGLITIGRDWDANSRLVAVTDDPDTSQRLGPGPGITKFEYDALDRRVLTIEADGGRRASRWDRDDNRVQSADGNGSRIKRTFDDLDRVVQVDVDPADGVEGTGRQTFEYDGLSRVTRHTDDNGGLPAEVDAGYDSLSRLRVEVQHVTGLEPRVVGQEHDRNSNRVRVTYPGRFAEAGRRNVTYGYLDVAGRTLDRVERIEEGEGTSAGRGIVPSGAPALLIASYAYAGPDRIIGRRFGNGVDGRGISMTSRYDALRRRVEIGHGRPGDLLASYSYVFDKVDNRLVESSDHLESADTYAYDSAGRLVGEARGVRSIDRTPNRVANPVIAAPAAATRVWSTMDGANNWNAVDRTTAGTTATTVVTEANEVNEYVAVDDGAGPVTRRHDANGNLVEDDTNRYAYDAFDRLVRVERRNDDVTIARYAYDARGRRVLRKVTGTTADESLAYAYLGDAVIEETDDTGRPVRQYVWGPDGCLQMQLAAGAVYLQENGYGSITMTTAETSDSVFDQRVYDAYGVVRESGSPSGLPYAFRGWRLDDETGFYAIGGGRAFDPSLGRTISRGRGSLENGYAWGGNNLLALETSARLRILQGRVPGEGQAGNAGAGYDESWLPTAQDRAYTSPVWSVPSDERSILAPPNRSPTTRGLSVGKGQYDQRVDPISGAPFECASESRGSAVSHDRRGDRCVGARPRGVGTTGR